MRTIYVDFKHHCHVAEDSTMTTIETDFFDGKCDEFIEGHCYDTSKGYVQIYPWKPYSELYKAQLISEYEAALSRIEAALGV